MAQKLYRVGDTNWYILVDTDKQEIIGQYNKMTALENKVEQM